jgi:hypothetical protein
MFSGLWMFIKSTLALCPVFGGNFNVEVRDKVIDGCWTNPEAIKNRVLSRLEQSGIKAYDEPFFIYNFFNVKFLVNVIGYQIDSSSCVASIDYSVLSKARTDYGNKETIGHIWSIESQSILSQSNILLSGKKPLNDQILSEVDSLTNELVDLVYANRRKPGVDKLIESMPHLKETVTEKRFLEIFSETMNK